MDKYRKEIQQMINDDDKKNEIIEILNKLYYLFSINNKEYRKYWTPLYIFDNFVDYITCNGILYSLNKDAQRYFESYITMKYFSKGPPVYCPK